MLLEFQFPNGFYCSKREKAHDFMKFMCVLQNTIIDKDRVERDLTEVSLSFCESINQGQSTGRIDNGEKKVGDIL